MRHRVLVPILWLSACAFPMAQEGVRAGDHRAKRLNIPPVQEIEILDPRVDPQGKPRAVPVSAGDHLKIAIPETVLVHKFYYTGDRTFQGPSLTGGPTIVVATNPLTNEREYLPVVMPPGAPVVHYRRHSITYDFHTEAIVVSFRHCGRTYVTIKNEPYHPLSGPANPPHEGVLQTVGNVVTTSAQNVVAAGRVLSRPFVATFQALPLSRTPEDRAAQQQADSVQHGATQAQQLDATIPTNR
jgi:hypothetical protein